MTECCIRAYRHGTELACSPCRSMDWVDWTLVGILAALALWLAWCIWKVMTLP